MSKRTATYTDDQLARTFDATNLKLDTSDADIRVLCQDATRFGCAAVCVYLSQVPLARTCLAESPVRVATVIGFPHGRLPVEAKLLELRLAAQAGAHEVDIVMNHPLLAEGRSGPLADELLALCQSARELGLLSKIIVETCYLDESQKTEILHLCENAGADYIKTSTGFGSAGASVEDVARWASLRKTIKIKASGGIRTKAQAMALLEAGADRLGLSSASAILGA